MPDSGRWRYSPRIHRYVRITSGRILQPKTLIVLRDEFAHTAAADARLLAARVAAGELTPHAFGQAMRAIVKERSAAQYMLGRGGRGAMTPRDWGRLGALVKTQYTYLNGLVEGMAAGTVTPARAAARAAMYGESTTTPYESGFSAGYDLSLPAYPGDGSTVCLSNCRCAWLYVQTRDAWLCTWSLRDAVPCRDCAGRAIQWAPLRLPRTNAARGARLVRAGLAPGTLMRWRPWPAQSSPLIKIPPAPRPVPRPARPSAATSGSAR